LLGEERRRVLTRLHIIAVFDKKDDELWGEFGAEEEVKEGKGGYDRYQASASSL